MNDADRAPHCGSPGRGYSLLEVIIATGVLTTSTVLLLNVFSTGDRHSVRAERRVHAQMLCQSTLDELLADPTQIHSVVRERIRREPDWTISVDWTPTHIDGLMRLRVAVFHEAEHNSRRVGSASDTTSTSSAKIRPDEAQAVSDFELIRWVRAETQNDE